MGELRRSRRLTAAVAAAATVWFLFLSATPASAVVGGTDDTANRFANVGVLQLRDGGEWFDFCSGTLVGDDVVLTAAHCTDFFSADVGEDGLGPDDLRVSFDPDPDASSTYYVADHIVVHPDWFTAPACLGNSKRLCLAPPAEDIALVWLTETVAGLDPAPIADADYVDPLDLTSEVFTVVGYGVDEFITGSLLAPQAIVLVDGIRSYRDVSVITTHDAFPDRFFKLTQSTCFGDSGGPLFHEETVVGINTWTFSTRCSGPNFAYRTDSVVAQAFLDQYL
ncbi:MAG TPA: S1 family peptidase [Actinomycetota bacterium]|nr:S1 family peptidase [Actinomycetota bacterium]